MPYRAGFWIRVLATGIDFVAMMLVTAALAVAVVVLQSRTSFRIAEGGFAAVLYVVVLVYTSSEVFAATTLGKLVFRLRISNADCTPTDFWRLFLRWSTKWSWLGLNLLFLLSEWSPLYVLGGFTSLIVSIGCLYAANDDRLTWHDQWAQTAVCYRPRSYRSFDAIVPPPPLPPPAQPPPTA